MTDNTTVMLDFGADVSISGANKKYINALQDILPFNITLDNGPWICGGIPRRLIAGHALQDGDVDIYFKSNYLRDQGHKALLERFGANAQAISDKSAFKFDNGVTNTTVKISGPTDLPPVLSVQLMSCDAGYPTLTSVLTSFDYTCCMAATDFNKILTYMRPYYDIQNKILRINNINDLRLSVPRLYKYMQQGFMPIPPTVEILIDSVGKGTSLNIKSKYMEDEAKFNRFVVAVTERKLNNTVAHGAQHPQVIMSTVTARVPSTPTLPRDWVSMFDRYPVAGLQQNTQNQLYAYGGEAGGRGGTAQVQVGGGGGGMAQADNAGRAGMVWMNEIQTMQQTAPVRPGSIVSISRGPYSPENVIREPREPIGVDDETFIEMPF